MRSTISFRMLARVLAVLGLACGVERAAAQVGVPDALDPTRVAIELASKDADLDLAAIEARLGSAVISTGLYGPRTFRLLELASPLPPLPERLERLRAVAALPGVSFAAPVWTGELGLPEFPTRHALARFLPDVPDFVQRAALASVGGLRIERELFGGMDGAWRLESAARTGDEVLAQVAALASLPGIKWAEPDRVLGAVMHDVIPNDPLFPSSWGLHNTGQTTGGVPDVDMDAPEAWDHSQGSAGILVVVLDNGVELGHPDLNLGPSADFTDSGSGGGPTASNACHGTAVAGCVAARINNAIGSSGIAPQCRVSSASVLVPAPFLLCPNGVTVLTSWLVEALTWAQLIGARVTNWSFGTSADSAVEDMLELTNQNGMIHFASSGNSWPFPIGFPANFHAVNAIGSVQSDGTKASSSQQGSELAFCAPGVGIQTTDRQGTAGYNTAAGTAGDYTSVNGTSFASPHAAGVAALVLSRQPTLSAHEVWLCLVASAMEMGAPGTDSLFGNGMVNAHKSVYVADEIAVGWVVVDPIAPTTPAIGSYHTFAEAVTAVTPGGVLLPIPTSYNESLLISKACILRSGGTQNTVIGQ